MLTGTPASPARHEDFSHCLPPFLPRDTLPSTLATPEARRGVVYDSIRWTTPATSGQVLAFPAPEFERVPAHARLALAGPGLIGIGQRSLRHRPQSCLFSRPATIQPVMVPAAITGAAPPFPSLPTDRT